MQSYNPIYRRYIDESKTTTPAKMLRGKFYLIKQYEYVDGTKGNYTPNTSPIIYTLFTSKAKDIVHAIKVSNIHPQLIKRFFGKFVDVDEQKLKMKGGAQAFYEGVVSKVKIVKNDAYRTYKMSGLKKVIELNMDVNQLTPKSKNVIGIDKRSQIRNR